MNKSSRRIRTIVAALAGMAVGMGGFASPAHAAEPEKYHFTLDMAECGVMAVGVSGTCIRSLQTWLNIADGANLNVDSYFGAPTEVAVRHFQRRFGLVPDGRFGDNSRNALRGWFQEVTANSVATPRPGAKVSVPLDAGEAGEGLHSGMGYTVATALVCGGVGFGVGAVTAGAGGLAAGIACDIILDD
jgi:hypothetical protein